MSNKKLIKVLQLTIDELKLEEDSKDDDDETEETQPKNGTEVADYDLEDLSDEDLKGKREYPPEVFLAF